MKKVEIVRVVGYRPGEVAYLADPAAETYARNGQVKPVGWSVDEPRPRRRKARKVEHEPVEDKPEDDS